MAAVAVEYWAVASSFSATLVACYYHAFKEVEAHLDRERGATWPWLELQQHGSVAGGRNVGLLIRVVR